MNIRLIANTAGYILWVEAAFLLLPLIVSFIYADGCWSTFLLCAAICFVVGTLLRLCKAKRTNLHNRDGYATVALAWVLLTLFGALPYVFTGAIPHYIDAVFETASGLTTTGASILTQTCESFEVLRQNGLDEPKSYLCPSTTTAGWQAAATMRKVRRKSQ